MQSTFTYQQIKKAYKSKGYTFFAGHLNLNVGAIRMGDIFTDRFTDLVFVAYEENGEEKLFIAPCTTKAGSYWEKTQIITHAGVTGTAVVLEGQYRSAYTFIDNFSNYHRGPCLWQTAPIIVLRDGDRDGEIDRDSPIQKGYFGCNWHYGNGTQIYNWSAGCIVITPPHYNTWVGLLRASANVYGKKFTTTIFHSNDF